MKKLTITIDDDVYQALHATIGRGNISRFINDVTRPLVLEDALEAGYKAMAKDESREADAEEWEALGITDVSETR